MFLRVRHFVTDNYILMKNQFDFALNDIYSKNQVAEEMTE